MALASCQVDANITPESVAETDTSKLKSLQEAKLGVKPVYTCESSSDCPADTLCSSGKCVEHIPTTYCDNAYFESKPAYYSGKCVEFFQMYKNHNPGAEAVLLYECREKPLSTTVVENVCPEGTVLNGGATSYKCVSAKPFTFLGCLTDFELGQDYAQKGAKDTFSTKFFIECFRKGLERYIWEYKWQRHDESICGDTGARYLGDYSQTQKVTDENGKETPETQRGYCCVRE